MTDTGILVALESKRVNRLAIVSAFVLLAGYACIAFVLRGADLWFQRLAVVICIVAALLALVAVIWIARRSQRGLWLAIPVLLLSFVGMFFGEAEIGMTRTPHDEAYAVGSLRTLNQALVTYARAHQSEGYPSSLSRLSCQEESWCIDSVLASGTKNRFHFIYTAQASEPNGIRDRYQIFAAPIHDSDDRRHFFTDDSRAIRYGYGKADQSSPALN